MTPDGGQRAPTAHQIVARNAVFLTVGQGLTQILSVAWVFVLARVLGVEQYGIFGLAAAAVGIGMTLADPGVTATTVRRVNTNDSTPIEAELWSAFIVRLVLSCVAASAIAAYAQTLAPPAARMAILIYSLIIPIEAVHGTAIAAFRARQRMQFEAYSILVFRIVSIVIGLTLLALGAGTVGVVVAYLGASVVTSVLSVLWLRSLLTRLTLPRFNLSHATRLLRESIPLGIGLFLSLIYFRVDVLLMGGLTSLREVGIYAAAYKSTDALLMLQTPVATAMFPALARLLKSDSDQALRLAGRVASVTVFLASLFLIVVVGFGDWIVRAMFGKGYEGTAFVLNLLCIALVAMAVNGTLNSLLVASFHQRILTTNALILSFLNIAVNVALIPRFGAIGAATATIVVEYTLLLMALGWLVHFGHNVVRYLAPALLIAVGPIACAVVEPYFPNLRIPLSLAALALTSVAALRTGTVTSTTPRSLINLFLRARRTDAVADII